MECCGRAFGKSQSILKGMTYKIPLNLSITDYFRKCIIEGSIDAEAPAVVAEDGHTVALTFNSLDSLSTKLAKALRQYLGFWTCNNPDGDLVMAFALPISENLPVILLAILKLGAAFLAIPTIYPEQLIVKIVSVTRPMIIITESTELTKSRYDCVSGLVTLVDFEEIMDLAINGGFDDINEAFPLETLTKPSARMASIVYTAGTMDQQLAVRIGHREILNRCLWQYKEFPYMEGEVQALSSGMEDIDSIAEIFAPLLAGVPLHLIKRKIFTDPLSLIKRISDTKVSRLTLAPPTLAAILKVYGELSEAEQKSLSLLSVKYWTVSGDAMSFELVSKFFEVLCPEKLPPHHHHHHHHHHHQKDSKLKHDISTAKVTLIHLYGSTEVMSDVTYEAFENCSHLKSKFKDEKVSIGKPIGNTIIYVVDEDMRIVENGVIGEICVAGACVASGGYVIGTERDDTDRFCTNPFTKKKGYTTIYLTEDFGRIYETKEGDTHLFYEGRTEMKAKVKGKHIDLRDIAKLVNETKLVEKCSVLCFHPGKLDQAVVAFCILLPEVTQKNLEETLKRNIKEEHLLPCIYVVEHFYYLPSGRLDKHKLLKQYFYYKMNASSEEWQSIHVMPHQKSSAKVLFAAIAKYTGKSLRQVIEGSNGSLWSLGVNSLNALAIFLDLRNSGFILNIDGFLKAENLLTIVEGMRQLKTKNKETSMNSQKFKLFSMPHEKFYAESLRSADKDHVLRMVGKSYSKKNFMCQHLHISAEDYSKFIESQWLDIVKDELSLVAYANFDGDLKPIGAVLVMDASGHLKCPSHMAHSIKYIVELISSTDKAPKEHIVWKKRGTVSQIAFLGTSESLSTENNILVVALLLEASKVRAKFKGYNGTIVSGANPLIIDMCEGILNYKVLEEVPIYKFRAKDKTLPFRLISEYLTFQVLYQSF